MLKALTYLLVIAYISLLVKPVMPYFFDALAHMLWKYEHIATVHKEKGNYHLHYELVNSAEKKDTGTTIPITGTDPLAAPHILSDKIVMAEAPVSTLAPHAPHWQIYMPVVYYGIHLPPPRARA